MEKFLIHSQYYPPEIGAPQARLSELAIGLIERSFAVKILTAMPNYPQGKLYEGYFGFHKKEVLDEVPITRTWIFPSKSLGFIPRLMNYFSFVFSSLLFGVFDRGEVDYILTESPPLFLGLSGFLLSRIKGAKWIFNVSDLWPESAVLLGVLKKGLFLSLANCLERFCYRHAWLVTGQSESILESIQRRYPDVRTYHLSNGVNTELFTPENDQENIIMELKPNDELIVFYGGLHGLAQGLEQILYVAKMVPKGIHFILIGDGPEKENLIDLAKDMGLTNLDFLDAVEKERMPNILASVDICLVPLKISLPGAVPSKLYEAMASEKPVIMIADGEAGNIVRKNEAGFVVSPGDIPGIVNAINRLAEDPNLRERMGNNGRAATIKYYARDKIIDDFVSYLHNNLK